MIAQNTLCKLTQGHGSNLHSGGPGRRVMGWRQAGSDGALGLTGLPRCRGRGAVCAYFNASVVTLLGRTSASKSSQESGLLNR